MIVSERGKRSADKRVMDWFAPVPDSSLFIGVISLGEIASGTARHRNLDRAFSERLDVWASEPRNDFEVRALAVTAATALRWGELVARLKRRDTDLLIAATALEHDVTVVTRNIRHFEIRHFEPTGAKVLNPYLVP